jgi:hypothetical protein
MVAESIHNQNANLAASSFCKRGKKAGRDDRQQANDRPQLHSLNLLSLQKGVNQKPCSLVIIHGRTVG